MAQARRSRRWTAAQAETVITELERSGLSVRQFAAREGVQPERLNRWRRKLRRQRGQLTVARRQSVGFTEFSSTGKAVAMHHAHSEEAVEIVVRSGLAVRVPAAFDANVLRRVLAILAEK